MWLAKLRVEERRAAQLYLRVSFGSLESDAMSEWLRAVATREHSEVGEFALLSKTAVWTLNAASDRLDAATVARESSTRSQRSYEHT